MSYKSTEFVKFFDEMYNYAPIGIALLDLDGKLMHGNPALFKMLGYSKEELFGLDFISVTSPDDREERLRSVSLLGEGQMSAYATEQRYVTKDRRIVWASLHDYVARDEQGKPLYYISHLVDITDRKRNEREQGQIQLLHKLITDHVQDVVSYLTPDGVCRYVSPSVKSMLGYEPEEFIGKNNKDLQHPEDLRQLQGRNNEDADVVTFRLKHKDGHYIWVEVNYTVVRNGLGEMEYIIGVTRNVDQAVRQHQLLKQAQQVASLGSWKWDIVNDKVEWSDQMYRLLEVDPASFEGSFIPTFQLYYEEDHGLLQEAVERALSGHELQVQVRRKREDGSFKYLHILGTLERDAHGVPLQLFGTLQDVTERNKLIVAKEAAESAAKARNEFLTMISHEVRTPLNGILGHADLLSETPLTQSQRDSVLTIRQSGNVLLSMMNGILDFSAMDSGVFPLAKEPYSLEDAVRASIELFRKEADGKMIELSWSYDSRLPRVVLGDETRIRQIFINLLGNALKFTEKGNVTIAVSRNDSPEVPEGLLVTIEDTGIGIEPDHLDGIFKPFTQLDASMSRKYGGTGLGLAITARLVELMGGTVRVSSIKGSGTTFRVKLPLMLPDEPAAPKVDHIWSLPGQEGVVKGLRILIAEDHEMNRKVLYMMLKKYGHHIDMAENGQEAVDAVTSKVYDLVLMDIQMPIMDGIEAARHIRERIPHGRVPVMIAVTANALLGDKEKYLECGMDDYISKPLKLEWLDQVIQRHFSGSSGRFF
ncbi:PAS domain S-box protein [Paenibacillus gansuensis]|uniref:histidine kinase n=1 Tax=Paenibacillus gansuensis TaxID=306542 RepID=A0ABW5PA13_9BACL